MKKLWGDKIALITALIGVILMVLTIIWRVNPVEGSVLPDFLKTTFVGKCIFYLLFGTSMPVWFLISMVDQLIPFSFHLPWFILCGGILVVQAFVYFWIGKLISLLVHKLKRK